MILTGESTCASCGLDPTSEIRETGFLTSRTLNRERRCP